MCPGGERREGGGGGREGSWEVCVLVCVCVSWCVCGRGEGGGKREEGRERGNFVVWCGVIVCDGVCCVNCV